MRRLLGALIGAFVLLAAARASAEGEKSEEKGEEKGEKKEAAEEGRLPLSYTERPLTLPRFVLNPLAEFSVGRDGGETVVNLGLSAAFGITDDFEVEAVVAPLTLSPSLLYGQAEQRGPSIGATYRLLKGSFELGVHLDATLITYSPDSSLETNSGVVVRPGIPARIHIGKSIRIDAAAYLPIAVESTSPKYTAVVSTSGTTVGLQVPLAIAFDLLEPLHVGLSTGATIEDFNDAGATFAIPLGVFAGYAIGGKDGPILDIDPFFRWTRFVQPGVDAPADKIDTSDFQVGVELGGFFYL